MVSALGQPGQPGQPGQAGQHGRLGQPAAASGGRAHLVVAERGSFIGKKSERLVVYQNKSVVAEVPFFDLEQVTVATSGVSISSDAIYHCVEHGIQINFLSGSGKPYAKVTSPVLLGTVAIRREQYNAYRDRRGVALAKAFVEGKIKNQANVLKYFGKHRRKAQPEIYGQIAAAVARLDAHLKELTALDAPSVDELRGQLLSVEGRAAQHYWDLVQVLVAEKVKFPGREHRGAEDDLNAMLNYGYGVLYSQAWGALLLAGLEPFAGFLHVDRPGKPSLVLDFVEEFRQQVIDRPLLAMVTKGYAPRMEEGRLAEESRREVAAAVLERLETQETYDGKKHRIKTILHLQARRMAGFVRGDGRYRPFVGTW